MKTNATPLSPTGQHSAEGLTRRRFVQVLGAGLLVSVTGPALAQNRRRSSRGGGGPIAARIHLGADGRITVLTGKIEAGQGARAEITQAAAEELRVAPEAIDLIMGDTRLTPDDGITAGSRTTPSTLPAVRRGAAAAREVLVEMAAREWGVDPPAIEVADGRLKHAASGRSVTYAELAGRPSLAKAFQRPVGDGVTLTPVKSWRVMGQNFPRPNARALVTGEHRFPFDQVRPGMLYGKVLRPPAYRARLVSVDLAPARAIEGVVVVWDGDFVGVAAPTTHQARKALAAIEATARWEILPHPSSRELFEHLRTTARGGVPSNPFAGEFAQAAQSLERTYHVPYVQHAPMEPRAALAEWSDDGLTVWMGTQNPFGCQRELRRVFDLPADRVRVVVPDFGGGFGGKHTAEAAIEAARLAQAAGRPVIRQWTREEEFTWAYFRPAAVIDVAGALDAQGRLTHWHFVSINPGGAGLATPYRAPQRHERAVASQDPPLRQGSYRALGATANNFARECFMDELAALAGMDPLAFRLANLEEPRLRAVLIEAARRFGWEEKARRREPGVGVGLACGTEKGSFVAACVEIETDPSLRQLRVRRVCEVFECGAVVNPDNLRAQIQGAIIMGLGPVLREAMRFAGGRMGNASFERYRVPRFSDLPELDIHVLDRRDLPSVGGGETPIIAVAPAVANAVYHAVGRRIHALPVSAA
ncbi:MAG: isoquinoline 1-oxidoreductase [Verrucomicrobia bacterium]|nr:MAG: isoquinoline 1-oxidoreductase [Verrucomicrobiota bacterium]